MKIKDPFNRDKLFFTSDTHFCHQNIITYCNRPYGDVEEMNDALIKNWNSVVPKDSFVFHLGDFAFADHKVINQIKDQLNGNIYLIQGNHDRLKDVLKSSFVTVCDLAEITVADDEVTDEYQKLILCHYPLVTWHGSHKGWWHLYGHVHGGYVSPIANTIDVGVDVRNYTPMSYQDVKTEITKRALTAKRT